MFSVRSLRIAWVWRDVIAPKRSRMARATGIESPITRNARSCLKSPHATSKGALLGADCIEVNGSGEQGGVPHPALDEIRRYVASGCANPKPMPQSFTGRHRASNPHTLHRPFDVSPGGAAMNGPEPPI